MRLLAQGQTLAEVADRLVRSPYTVKAHTQNSYAKLDAHSRVETTNPWPVVPLPDAGPARSTGASSLQTRIHPLPFTHSPDDREARLRYA